MCCNTTHLLGRYKEEDKLLGTGEISKVYLGYDTVEDRPVAIKKIDKTKLTGPRRVRLQQEIVILRKLVGRSLYFIQLYDVYEDNQFVYLIMEYLPGGDLFDLIEQFPYGLPEALGKKIIKSIFVAISHLHKLNIAHLDLKLENIMYNSQTETIKIIDFGFAASPAENLAEWCGSIHYIAPQILHRVSYDGLKADVWSMGIITYALLAACFPFDDDNQHFIALQIKKGVFKIPPHFSPQAASFVQTILNPHEKVRPTIDEMLSHPFLEAECID